MTPIPPYSYRSSDGIFSRIFPNWHKKYDFAQYEARRDAELKSRGSQSGCWNEWAIEHGVDPVIIRRLVGVFCEYMDIPVDKVNPDDSGDAIFISPGHDLAFEDMLKALERIEVEAGPDNFSSEFIRLHTLGSMVVYLLGGGPKQTSDGR